MQKHSRGAWVLAIFLWGGDSDTIDPVPVRSNQPEDVSLTEFYCNNQLCLIGEQFVSFCDNFEKQIAQKCPRWKDKCLLVTNSWCFLIKTSDFNAI